MSDTIPHLEVTDLESSLVDKQCTTCGKNVFVSSTSRKFNEVHTGACLAWYGLRNGVAVLKGVTEMDSGDFECLSCHSKAWMQRVRASKQ